MLCCDSNSDYISELSSYLFNHATRPINYGFSAKTSEGECCKSGSKDGSKVQWKEEGQCYGYGREPACDKKVEKQAESAIVVIERYQSQDAASHE